MQLSRRVHSSLSSRQHLSKRAQLATAIKALKVGDVLPSFELITDTNETITSEVRPRVVGLECMQI